MDNYKPLNEELQVINEKFAKEPYKSREDLYAFPLLAIDNQMTAYFTKAHPNTLNKWAKDLNEGVSFLVGHEQSGIPIARSFKGSIHDHEGLIDLYGKFFMQRGIELQGIKTDDFMQAFLGGTLEDVSIGFKAGWYECSICGLDIRSLDCPHMPGKEYDVDGKKVLCFAWIMHSTEKPAQLVEVSAVYKGAVKRAKFKSKKSVPVNFINTPEELKEAELEKEVSMCYSIPFKKEETSDKDNQEMNDLKEKLKLAETNNKVLLEQNGALKTEIDGYKKIINKLEKEVDEVKKANIKLQEKADGLKAAAEDGKTYREDLIKEILELGIKLHGNSYDKDTNEKMFKEPTRNLDEIKKIRQQYLTELEEKFPARKQTGDGNAGLEEKSETSVPDEAFKIEGR